MRFSGSKYYNLNGTWDLKPKYLDPWTLREQHCNTEQVFWSAQILGIGLLMIVLPCEGLRRRFWDVRAFGSYGHFGRPVKVCRWPKEACFFWLNQV